MIFKNKIRIALLYYVNLLYIILRPEYNLIDLVRNTQNYYSVKMFYNFITISPRNLWPLDGRINIYIKIYYIK